MSNYTDVDIYGAKNKSVVYCDIDGTLIIWPENAGNPRYAKGRKLLPIINNDVVNLLKNLKSKGYYVALWSIGGAGHCEWAAEFCNIGNIVDAYLPKPRALIDDNYKWYDKQSKYSQKGVLINA